MQYAVFRVPTESAAAVLNAILGKGGGSGWDQVHQIRALVEKVDLRQGMVVFDIGANDGRWATDLAKHLPQADYHLFECAPYCFEPLERNVRSLTKHTIIKKAVSDKTGTAILHLPDAGSGLASIHKREDTSVSKHSYSQTPVSTVTIDGYADELGFDFIDVIKVDVEGHELAVFEGASKRLSEKRIGVVFFEFGSANLNSRTFFRDFWALFKGYGYDLYRVLPGGATLSISRYDDSLEYFRGASNYIAIKGQPE